MPWYHVFLTYRDAENALCRLIHYDIASVSALHQQLLTPLQTQRPLRIDGHTIPGIPAIQSFQVFQSARSFTALQLPDGSSPLDHAPDTVHFLFERGIVEGVMPYAPAIILPRLRAVLLSHNEASSADSLSRSEPTRARHLPSRRKPQVSRIAEAPRQDSEHPHLWLYYLLCGYAALGNTVLSGLVRWVETGSYPTALRALLRTDAAALAWPMLASMLVGLGLLAMYYLAQWGEHSSWRLTLLNCSLLVGIAFVNLINGFTLSPGDLASNGALFIYVVPYSLLVYVITGMTYTFTASRPSSLENVPHMRCVWLLLRQNRVLVLAALLMSLGGVTAYFQLSSAYHLAYPLWFGYLIGGIVLWGVIEYYQRRPAFQRPHTRTRLIHQSKQNETHDLALPPLPSLDTQGDGVMDLPSLPPLDS